MSRNSDNFKAGPLRPGKQLCSFGIIPELFFGSIPLYRSAYFHCDVCEVACRDAAVLVIDVRNRFAASFDAVEKVTHVVDNGIELAESFRANKIVKVVDGELLSGQRIH